MQTLMRKNKQNAWGLSGAAARTGVKNIKVIEKNVEMGRFEYAIKRRNVNTMITNIEYLYSVDRVGEKRIGIL